MAFPARTCPLLAITCGAGAAYGLELLAVRAAHDLDSLAPAVVSRAPQAQAQQQASAGGAPYLMARAQEASQGLLEVLRALLRPSAEQENRWQQQLHWSSAGGQDGSQEARSTGRSAFSFSSPWTSWQERRAHKQQQQAQEEVTEQPDGPEVVAAHSMAAQHQPELQEIRRRLREMGAPLSPDGLAGADTELMRFAFTAGLTHARTEGGRQEAVENAVKRAATTARWLTDHTFMQEAELQHWQHLVQWQGADAKGQPILVLQPAAVLSQPKPPPMELCAEAVISQVHAGIRNLVAHDCDPASSGMLVVVMDARGISGMQVMQLVWLVKEVAVTLNTHFPGRLAALWIVEPPAVLKWTLNGLRKLLHPATGQKVQVCDANDPVLPKSISPIVPQATVPVSSPAGGTENGLLRTDGMHYWYI